MDLEEHLAATMGHLTEYYLVMMKDLMKDLMTVLMMAVATVYMTVDSMDHQMVLRLEQMTEYCLEYKMDCYLGQKMVLMMA